jgi:hypothetical protein
MNWNLEHTYKNWNWKKEGKKNHILGSNLFLKQFWIYYFILFSEMFNIFKNYLFQIKKNIVKEKCGHLRTLFHLLKWMFQNSIYYSTTDMCWILIYTSNAFYSDDCGGAWKKIKI